MGHLGLCRNNCIICIFVLLLQKLKKKNLICNYVRNKIEVKFGATDLL